MKLRLLCLWLTAAASASARAQENVAGLQSASTQPASERSLFSDPDDGAFDISGFLSTRTGFLPLAVPITEPAVGYGLTIGLTFFHDHPTVVSAEGSEHPRVIMPSTTVVFGAATENGTWAGALAHLGMWERGRIRYVGAVGYANLNLNWFGTGDALRGHAISYTNQVFFVQQQITFQLGDSDFFVGPVYRFLGTDSSLATADRDTGIPDRDFQSQTSGAGVVLDYDTRDQPFSPNRGVRAEIQYTQQATWLGGDFDYYKLIGFYNFYIPVAQNLVLGIRLDGQLAEGDVPFYDLPFLNMRGISVGRFTDNAVVLAEAELRYDLTKRWSLLAFGGIGRVASSIGDLGSAENQPTVGLGFRYLIAREYGLRLGVDIAHSDDNCAFYVGVGTGWVRP